MNKLDMLKMQLAEQGWKFDKAFKDTGVDWYAWRMSLDNADCDSNEKPAQFVLVPYQIKSDYINECTVTIDISGDVGNDQWIDFSAYNIPSDEVMKRLKSICTMLTAAWNSACLIYR